MQALVLGATGLVGGHCLEYLLQRSEYEKVVTLGRRDMQLRSARHQHRLVDFARLTEQQASFVDADVYCCVGTTMKKAGSKQAFRDVDYGIPLSAGERAREAGSRQFLLVSAVQADPEAHVFYNRIKGETERALAELGLPSLQIFRPSLLLGDRDEIRLGERLATGPLCAIAPLMLGSMRKYRPVLASVVARAMVHAAALLPAGVTIYEFCAILDLAGTQD